MSTSRTMLARGRDQVARIQTALGGQAPARAGDIAREHLQLRLEAQQQAQLARRQRDGQFGQLQAALLALLRNDPTTATLLQEFEKRSKRHLKGLSTQRDMEVEPYVALGSLTTVKAPPYDDIWSTKSPLPPTSYSSADADKNGTFNLQIECNGDAGNVGAGVATWCFASIDNMASRISALVDYGYRWADNSWMGGTAHNDGALNLWVWGATEGKWVSQVSAPDARWSDGTAWNESHGSNGDGSEVDGRLPFETFFPAAAGNWYQAWVFASCSCDSYDSAFSGSDAYAFFHTTIPFMVFEQ